MSSSRFVVGIDLGTTHSVVAFADTAVPGKAHIVDLPIPQLTSPGEVAERPLFPSSRYQPAPGELDPEDLTLPWGGDGTAVGTIAMTLGAKVPSRLITSAKSWLSHDGVDRRAAILPWGAPHDVEKVSPVDASASYLSHLRATWNHRFPEAPLEEQETVLTIPASFDEGARALTLASAKLAGLGQVRLVEEPQAAFYAWLGDQDEDPSETLRDTRLVVVVDVGGGTTDLTLIQVELRDSGPRITRIAVGEHLMLGGDNMDLALASTLEPRLSSEGPLGTARFAQLLGEARKAKELLLGSDAPDSTTVTLLGVGSRLVGGAQKTTVQRTEVSEQILDGFFPIVAESDRPTQRQTGLIEFGLPFAADPAITKHLAAFLSQHRDLCQGAVGEGRVPLPDAVLFNGGVFHGAGLRERIRSNLENWSGGPVQVLQASAVDHAVARGAVHHGLARRGQGLRIGGGSARSYFLTVDGAAREGICILPKGSEEGEFVSLPGEGFSLRVGRPVRFDIASSTSDVRHHRPGDRVDLGEDYRDLPPLVAVLDGEGLEGVDPRSGEIPVTLEASLTEVGTLEIHCLHRGEQERRWKLEFQIRGKGLESAGTQRITTLHPRFQEATDAIRRVYGKSAEGAGERDAKTLRADLERCLGRRSEWDTALLRELFSALWAGAKHRRRSATHERVWFNLTGYCLRPGYGYPLDEWRIGELFGILRSGVQFLPEAQNWAEWWILWRRIAGGLSPEQQERVLDDFEWFLHPPTPRPRKRPPGPKKLGELDMVRLAGALEHPSPQRKYKIGQWLLSRVVEHGDSPSLWWAIGRLGARVPSYGSAHRVIEADLVEPWIRSALRTDLGQNPEAAFAAALLGRMSGDRARDIGSDLRGQVVSALRGADAPPAWVQMVEEVTHLDAEAERRVFGESLPPGLRPL
ncbi:MAG: hsp70 family protein [Myxococcales bacterium]|nr:hsp70 family protein [Myxococcales bacterium]